MKTKGTILGRLTSRSFRANRGRNIVAVCAIILTTLMFTSLFTISGSIIQNMREMNFQQAGYRSHLTFGPMTEDEADRIAAHGSITESGKTVVVGIAENTELTGRQTEIRYADASYARSTFSFPTVGKMPEAVNEVALDVITLDKLGIPRKIGGKVTLLWRKNLNDSDYISSDFILCGYWDGNSVAIASMAWVSDAFLREGFIQNGTSETDTQAQFDDGQVFGICQLHVDLANDKNLEGAAETILTDTGLSYVPYGVNFAYDTVMNHNILFEIVPMAIGMLLVFVSGYLIIYNIFQISVATDIRFYGKLKTLGSTKKQIKKIIIGQAARLCVIGVPIGLALGFVLGAVLVPLMITGTVGKAAVNANPLIFAGAALFAVVTVFLSCLRPAKLAGKVSPIEALRYTDTDTSVKRKTKKSKKGAELSRMALANLGRNKKRTVTVILSLTLGLTLLTALNAKNGSFDIDKYMGSTVISDFEVMDSSTASNFNVYNPFGSTISAELEQKIETLPGLTSTGRLYSMAFSHEIGASALANIQAFYNADGRLSYIRTVDTYLINAYDQMIETGTCQAVLYGIDGLIIDTFSEDYRVVEGVFDKELFARGNYVAVEASRGAEEKDYETQPTYSIGDFVTLVDKEYEVMCIVSSISTITEGVNGDDTEFISLYLPSNIFKELYPDNTIRKLFFNVENSRQAEAEAMLADYRKDTDKMLSYKSKTTLIEHFKEQTRASSIMGYALSVIIGIIGILNFINSMITAIVSRRKEFAMLQSVGMTKGQLRKMLIFEGLDYAAVTLVFSYILGAAAVGIVVRVMVEGDWLSTFRFDIMPLYICTPIIIAFAVIIPWICFKNAEKQSIIERLRNTD